MRFARHLRHEYIDTPRKRAALRRRQRLEREALPLLSTLIAEQQPDEDSVMLQRALDWLRMEEQHRARRAEQWRRARREISALGSNFRPLFLHWWNSHRWMPAEPTYLLDALHGLRTGRLVVTDDGAIRTAGYDRYLPIEEVRRRLLAAQQQRGVAQEKAA